MYSFCKISSTMRPWPNRVVTRSMPGTKYMRRALSNEMHAWFVPVRKLHPDIYRKTISDLAQQSS